MLRFFCNLIMLYIRLCIIVYLLNKNKNDLEFKIVVISCGNIEYNRCFLKKNFEIKMSD